MFKFILAFFLVGCGATARDDEAPVPVPPPVKTGLTFAGDVKPLLDKFCSKCHASDTFLSSEQAFLGSKAPIRIANKSMPQKQSANYSQWTDAERGLIANFVAGSSH